MHVKIIWLCISVCYAMLFSIAYANQKREDEERKSRPEFNPYNPDLDIIEHSARKLKGN